MKCDGCGVEFEPNRSWQRFHSKQCQQKWNKDRYRAEALNTLDANGKINPTEHNGGYRDKWAAIRAEWEREDREERQSRPRFVKRI